MPLSAHAYSRGHLHWWMMTCITWLRYAICQASPKTHSKVSFGSPFHPVIFERKSRCVDHTSRDGVRHRCPDGRESTYVIGNSAWEGISSPWHMPSSVFPGAVHRSLFEDWTPPALVRLFPGEASQESLRSRLSVAWEQAKGQNAGFQPLIFPLPTDILGQSLSSSGFTLVPLLHTTGRY